jgi:hypothetical protein
MEFKVGDRVEAIKGPSNTQHDDYIGPGTITAIRTNNRQGEDCQLDLDMGEKAWWFAEESLRPLKTPTPSITVGTQVRLTGVVAHMYRDGYLDIQLVGDEGNTTVTPEAAKHIKVIRQPFKRGEVIWSVGAVNTGEQYVVFNDEFEGRIDVVHCPTGTATTNNDASRFERRL